MKFFRPRKEILNIAWSWGYLWFLCLNIAFCFWLLLRGAEQDHNYLSSRNLESLNVSIIAFSVLNLVILGLTKNSKHTFFKVMFPFAVLILGVLWATWFYQTIEHYNEQTLALMLMFIILLPATIAFYISGPLLLMFCLPIVLSMLYSEIYSFQKFNLMQMVGTGIVLIMVITGRYILLEWYQRTQRSEQEKNQLIKKLTRLAHYDSLTGLFNKGSMVSFFTDNVPALTQQQNSLFLIVLDVDFFKQYNDIYGHVAGDECLLKTSKCIESSLRRADDAAFRFGGEEFVVMTFCEDISQAMAIAQRIQSNLAEARIRHKGSQISQWLTISIGIAQWRNEMQLDVLIENADKELYKAKHAGRNRISVEKPHF